MLVSLELKSANDVYSRLLYDALSARSAGMLNARSRSGVLVVETSFDVMRRRRRTYDTVALAAALPDLPLPAPASAQVCAAATALNEIDEEMRAALEAAELANNEAAASMNDSVPVESDTKNRQTRASIRDSWRKESNEPSSGSGTGSQAGVQAGSAAELARQELIDTVVGPMLDGTVQMVLPSVGMLRTCGDPLRLAAPRARMLGIPLPISAWTVDDVLTACDLWRNEGATGVVSNRAGFIAEAIASGACDVLPT